MWGSGRHSKNTPRASRLRRTGEANCTSLQNRNRTNSSRTSMKSRGLPQATLTVQRATPMARLAPRPTTLRSVPTHWYGDARRGRAQDGQGGRKLKPPTLSTAPLPRPSKGTAPVVGTREASVQIINFYRKLKRDNQRFRFKRRATTQKAGGRKIAGATAAREKTRHM